MYSTKQMLKSNIRAIVLLFSTVFLLSCSPKTYTLTKIEGKQVPVDSLMVLDVDVENYVAPYRDQLAAEMNTVLTYAPTELTRNRKEQETPLGNFIADLAFKRGNAVFHARTGKNIDFVLTNIGGLRASIMPGDVSVRNAYEVMPFENALVVAELTYEKVQELLQYLADSGDAHPISKQLNVVFKGKNIESALLNGQPFNPNRTYFVLSYDYLLNGGDSMTFFVNPVSTTPLDYLIRAALIDELKEIDTVPFIMDGRMKRI